MAPPKDPYRSLGVSKTATQDEIKARYRELAKKHHPDLNPGSKQAESKFKDISAAYEKIGTADARAKFDRGEAETASAEAEDARRSRSFYRDTQSGGGPGRYTHSFGEGLDEDDLLRNLFGGARAPRRGPSAGEDLHYQMEVDLKDAVLGAQKEISLPTRQAALGQDPPGVTDGTRLRFGGQGAPSVNGGPPGDAWVAIQVRPDPRFSVQEDHLVLELPLNVTDAIMGAEIRVPTLDGAVMLKIPPRSDAGARLRLPGKGLFNRVKNQRGDQYVVLRLTLPNPVDAELEEAIRQWRSRHPQPVAGGP